MLATSNYIDLSNIVASASSTITSNTLPLSSTAHSLIGVRLTVKNITFANDAILPVQNLVPSTFTSSNSAISINNGILAISSPGTSTIEARNSGINLAGNRVAPSVTTTAKIHAVTVFKNSNW
jgi:hypothetical protein